MIEYIPTKTKNGLIANVNSDIYNGFYLYDDIVWIEKYDYNAIELSNDFHRRKDCKLIKSYVNGKTIKEIWNITELMHSMGITPNHINLNDILKSIDLA